MRALPSTLLLLGLLVGAPTPASSIGSTDPAADPTRTVYSPGTLLPGTPVIDGPLELDVPDVGEGIAISAVGPQGSSSLEIDSLPDGTVVVSDLGPDLGLVEPTSPGQLACDDTAKSLKNYKWYTQYEWYFHGSSTPSEITVAEAESAISEGTRNITLANNNCGLPDNVSASQGYRGRTPKTDDLYQVRGADGVLRIKCRSEPDATSASAFADLPVKNEGGTKNFLGAACTWRRAHAGENEAVESDMRLNKEDYRWVVSLGPGCTSGFSVETVTMHERGHTFGLGHVNESRHPNLTMSTAINGPCQGSETTLGRGDIQGLQQLY